MLCYSGSGRPASGGCRWARRGLVAAALAAMMGALPGSATAAKLIGGREQAAVARAFAPIAAGRHQLIVSIRASTVAPSWVVVKSVTPGSTSHLTSTYFQVVGMRVRRGAPPQPALADLSAPFSVALVYRGSGSESIAYQQTYRTVCAGAGGYVVTQADTVSPMSWTVRYLVDLDRVISAVDTPQGGAILPAVAYQAASSQLAASEKLTRTAVDQGCFGAPATSRCTTSFHLTTAGAGSELAFDPGAGTEIGIPMAGRTSGQCAPEDYTLGPSLWDGGAATALVPSIGTLGMLGARLPGNPYAPIRVSWPSSSAELSEGFLATPCQGITAVCTDRLSWHGIVQIQPVGGHG
jgi:hypothetical protein